MATIDPSLQRYQTLRARFNELPADRDGLRMNTQHMEVAELNGSIPLGSSTDEDPDTPDIINLTSNGYKGNHRFESFVEMPAPRGGWWNTRQGNETLVHLTRQVTRVAGGYSLSELALRTVDLVTGELVSEVNGQAALKGAQKLDDQVPFRLHYLDPLEHERPGEENWLSPDSAARSGPPR